MTALANIALFGCLVILGAAAMATLLGLDRRMEERKARKERDRFDVFTDGEWR
jgi:hypothetical protein